MPLAGQRGLKGAAIAAGRHWPWQADSILFLGQNSPSGHFRCTLLGCNLSHRTKRTHSLVSGIARWKRESQYFRKSVSLFFLSIRLYCYFLSKMLRNSSILRNCPLGEKKSAAGFRRGRSPGHKRGNYSRPLSSFASQLERPGRVPPQPASPAAMTPLHLLHALHGAHGFPPAQMERRWRWRIWRTPPRRQIRRPEMNPAARLSPAQVESTAWTL